MCSWSGGTLLWYVLPMVEGRQRDPTVGGKMFFPEARHVESYTGTAAGSIRSCGCLYGCPSGTLNTPPSALARFISYPTQYVCFALLQFQLSFLFNNNPSSSFPSYFFFLWCLPTVGELCPAPSFSLPPPYPSTSLISHLAIPPPHFFSFATWVYGYMCVCVFWGVVVVVNASAMTGFGSQCWAVSNHCFCDWGWEQSGDNRAHLAKSHISQTEKCSRREKNGGGGWERYG